MKRQMVPSGFLEKVVRIKDVRRYSYIALLLTFIQIGVSFGQEDGLSKRITIVADSISLDEALNRISEISKLNISYVHGIFDIQEIISINVIDKTIHEILDELLKDYALDYELIEKQLIIKKSVNKEIIEQPVIEKTYTINGYLKDSSNNELLIGATVYAENILKGTITNGYGFYSLTLPEGDYRIVYSYIGYDAVYRDIKLEKDVSFSPVLKLSETKLKEVIVYSSEQEKEMDKVRMSQVKLMPREVKFSPGIFGEGDFIKILNAIPGIKTFGGTSSLFYVRGGFRDQNLILIDEAPVYNTSHLLGFISTFSPNAIKDIKVYTGNIPARYGGRLSSVIDIKTKDGDMNKFRFSGSYGLLSTTLSAEGPLKKEKSSFFISLRNSHLKWIYKRMSSDAYVNFYDLHAKINAKITSKDRMFFSFYAGNDFFGNQYDNGKEGLSWGNFAASLRWNHLFSEKLFSNTTLYSSAYEYFIYPNPSLLFFWKSSIGSLTLKTDFTYYKSPDNTFRFGYEASGYLFIPGNLTTENVFLNTNKQVSIRQANNRTLYISKETKLNSKFYYSIGFRLPVWRNIGPGKIYSYNETGELDTAQYSKNKPYEPVFSFEPRLHASYTINDFNAINLSFTSTSQHMQVISNSISPLTSIEVWLPYGPNIKPQKAMQIALAYNKEFVKKEISFTVETFAKKLSNQIDYSYHSNTLLNPLIELELKYGNATAYGAEFQIKKKYGNFTGWIAYTLSRTYKYIENHYGNKRFPAIYDRPHDFSIFLIYEKNSRSLFSANWVLTSGTPFSSPTSFFVYENRLLPVYTEKNNDRLPPYHRLDVLYRYRLNKREQRFNHSLAFSVYNIYNRKNVFAINFNKTLDDNGDIVI
ncbi:carboxypeptidase-like regulatory domain-containing protein, partial [Bacteroidota bacterium]